MARVVALCATIAGGTALGQAGATAPGTSEDWSLVLSNAFGEGRDIQLYVAWKDGRVDGAFARAPRFNRMCYPVEAKDVSLSDGRLVGTFGITVPWDGWVPRDRKGLALAAKMDAAATASGFEGTYEISETPASVAQPPPTGSDTKGAAAPPFAKPAAEPKVTKGKLAGTRAAPMPAGAVCRLSLSCEDTISKTQGMGGARRISMALSFKDGRSFAARLIPPGSITDVGMATLVEKHALQFDGRSVSGTLSGAMRGQGRMDTAIRYEFAFRGLVVGGETGGWIEVTEDGKACSQGCFVGSVSVGAPDPTDALYSMTLHGSLPKHNFLNVSFTTRKGEILGGYATSPNFNNSIHTVDFSGLRLAEGRLRGPLAVTIMPDAWIPSDHQPVSCRYELDTAVADGELIGKFTGTFATQAVDGVVEGGCDRKLKLGPVTRMTLKVENGTFGRAFLNMRFANGKLIGSSIGNNHDSALTGTVTRAEMSFADEKIRGSVDLTLGRKGSPKTGTYSVSVDSYLVGKMGAGPADTTSWDGRRKQSTFWAAIAADTE
jgi:hypothetical protein